MAVRNYTNNPCFPLTTSSEEAATEAAARANEAAQAAETATETANQAASDASDAKDAADAAVAEVNAKLALVAELEEIYGGAFVNQSANGSTINITDGADNVPVKSLIVAISGASPALTAVTINKTVNGLNTPYTMQLVSGGTQLSVTEGTLDFVNGVLVSGGVTYNIDDGGIEVPTSLGANTFATSAGVMNMVYRADPEIYGKENYLYVVKISDTSTTLGDVLSQLNTISANGYHVVFDVSALGAQMYLCTIFIDSSEGVYKVFDLVRGRVAEGSYDSSLLLTMAIAQASNVATQQQIDYLQGEIDELGGKSVVQNLSVLGDMIRDGTSTDIIQPGDMIDLNWIASVLGTTTSGLTVTCGDMQKFINAVGEAEARDYLFVYDGSSWNYGETAVQLSDYGLSVTGTPATGEVMTVKTTVRTVSYTFTGYDKIKPSDDGVPHNWCIEQTYAPLTKAFDTYESLFCIQPGKAVPAGNYFIPMYSYRSGKTFNVCFTLSSFEAYAEKRQLRCNGYASGTIPANDGTIVSGVPAPNTITPIAYGTREALGNTIQISYRADSDLAGYTLLTSLNVSTDSPTVLLGDIDQAALGNNSWALSNNRQWLNSEAQNGAYQPSHDNDIGADYNYTAGFLYGLDPRAKEIIQYADVLWTAGQGNPNTPHYVAADGLAPVTDAPTYYERSGAPGARTYSPLNPQPAAGEDVSGYYVQQPKYMQSQTYTSEDRVFLLSMREMSYDINANEGQAMDLYSEYTSGVYTNTAVAARAKYNKAGGTINSYRWSRSASTSYANNAWVVTSTGASNSGALGARFYAPAFIIGKSTNQ